MRKNVYLNELLGLAERMGFDQRERHDVCEVARHAYEAFLSRHPAHIDQKDSATREYYECLAWEHAAAVGRQYVAEEVDKWNRRGYKHQADGCP